MENIAYPKIGMMTDTMDNKNRKLTESQSLSPKHSATEVISRKSKSPSPALPSQLDSILSPYSYEKDASNSKWNSTGNDPQKKTDASGIQPKEKLSIGEKMKMISEISLEKLDVQSKQCISRARGKRRSLNKSPMGKQRSGSRSPQKVSHSPLKSSRSPERRRRSVSHERRKRSPSRSVSKERRRRSRSRSREYRRRRKRSRSRTPPRRRSRSVNQRRSPYSRSPRRRSRSPRYHHSQRRSRNESPPHRRRSFTPSPPRSVTRAVLQEGKGKKIVSTEEVEARLAEHMKNVKERAQEEAKKINLPGYLNPAMVNVQQFKQLREKRKLLWSKAKEKKGGAQWNGAFEDETSDEKFRRLMGIHESNFGEEASGSQVEHSRKVLDELEKEYEKSRVFQLSRGAGGVTGIGLGFGSGPAMQ